jgi:SAM-dependent methyltransferase
MATLPGEEWAGGELYEQYMGRWSRRVAAEFLRWLAPPNAQRWVDVGCGSGALCGALIDCCAPLEVVGIDPAPAFVAYAGRLLPDARAAFRIGSATEIPATDKYFDGAVSGLVFNFLPDPVAALAEVQRVTAPGALVGLYVWDYAERMEWLRYFWDAAIAVNRAAASEADEGPRFPLCRPGALQALFEQAGFAQVQTGAIEARAHFADFDDYWQPFVAGGRFPSPAYLYTRPVEERAAIRDYLDHTLPRQADGSIDLAMRAWAVQGRI